MKHATQENLIKAGAKAMLAKSYHAVGIQEVLSAVDVPKGSFYHYFDSKEDFGVAIIEYYGRQLAHSLQVKLADPSLTPRQRLRDYFLSVRQYYASHGCSQGCLVAKLATEIGASSPRMREALKAQFDSWTTLVAACIAEAQQAGELDAAHNPAVLAEFIYSSWEGALIRMQVNHDLTAIDHFMEYIFGVMLPDGRD